MQGFSLNINWWSPTLWYPCSTYRLYTLTNLPNISQRLENIFKNSSRTLGISPLSPTAMLHFVFQHKLYTSSLKKIPCEKYLEMLLKLTIESENCSELYVWESMVLAFKSPCFVCTIHVYTSVYAHVYLSVQLPGIFLLLFLLRVHWQIPLVEYLHICHHTGTSLLPPPPPSLLLFICLT